MAADSYGPKREPQFAGSGVPNDAGDLTLVAAYAASVGNRRAGTSAERTQATAAGEVWDGLEWIETDTALVWVYLSGWLLVTDYASRYSMPPGSTVQVGPGQTKDIATATLNPVTPQNVWISFTSLSQIAIGQTNNWAGNLSIAVNGVQVGFYRRVGNLNAENNAPVPLDRLVKARLAVGTAKITARLSVDGPSSTSPFINNPQIEVWPA